MPTSQMFPPKRGVSAMTVKIIEHSYELWPTVSVQVDVEMTDGTLATLARWERGRNDLDKISEVYRDLADAFLWGEGLRAVIATVQSEDRSAQSRRVRRALETE